MKAAQAIKAHFVAYRSRAMWSFLWRITLEGLAAAVIAAMIAKLIFDLPDRPDFRGGGITLFIEIVVMAPFFETLLLQSFPVMLARRIGCSFRGQLFAAWLPFALLHFVAGAAAGICAGFVSGFYIAFTYTHWRHVSLRSAFWMTASSHALHNLGPGIAVLLRAA